MNYQEVREFLEQADVLPSKKLGQNFLVDSNVCRWFVDQLNIQEGDTVVEVGPGTGSLTQYILEDATRVVLIEFDRRLAESLVEKYKDNPKVKVHHADAVQFDTRTLFADSPIKLIGNLPYSAGGAIMRNFLERPSPVTRAVLMLQKEVIDRMCAQPRTKDYGVLTLRTQCDWEVEPAKTVPPEAFYPRPSIDSTVAVLKRRSVDFPAYDHKLFDSLIRRAFSQRRKQMRKAMPDDGPEWAAVVAELGITETARAEELTLEQWIELTRLYDTHPLKDVPQSNAELLDVVDEDDAPVRAERRDVIHRDDLLHRAVHILVFNKKREVFLQKRSRFKDKCPGLWDSSAAGHVDTGEAYLQTAVRELDEELGVALPADALKEIVKLGPSEQTGWEFIMLYLTRYDGVVSYPCSEVETGMWLAIPELDRWIAQRASDFAPGFIECWKAFRDLIKEE